MHDQPSFAKKMLQLGAKAYITKSSSCEEVFTAINVVMKGAVYICTEIKNSLSDQVMKEEFINPGAKDLSMREIEIIKLIREGLSSKEISTLINIRPRTVEVHRHNILKKLKFKNTATLVNFINNTDHNFN
jgi:DNA-binding NarL/FixJ family response regulator